MLKLVETFKEDFPCVETHKSCSVAIHCVYSTDVLQIQNPRCFHFTFICFPAEGCSEAERCMK